MIQSFVIDYNYLNGNLKYGNSQTMRSRVIVKGINFSMSN